MPNSVKAIQLVVGASASVATMHSIVRYLTVEEEQLAFEVAFFRGFIGLIIFIPIIARNGFGLLRTDMLPWHFGRGLVNAGAMLCMVTALSLIPVGDVAAISLVEPVSAMRMVWAAVISYVVFTEFPDIWTWVGAGIIVVGTTYMARRDVAHGVQRPPPTTEG